MSKIAFLHQKIRRKNDDELANDISSLPTKRAILSHIVTQTVP